MGKHQIMSVPKEARRTSDWDMFATWVGANANNGTWFIGGVIAACGFAVAMKVLVLSSAVSYLFLSLIGYIGYKTGVSTMELSRASFGIRGSFLPSIVNMTQFIGWTAVNTFIAATSVSYLLHDLLSWPVYGKPADCILLNKSDFHHVLMDHSEVLYNSRHGKISLKFTDKQ